MKIRPIKVTPLENYLLLVIFNNNERRVFDVKPYIEGPWYGKLSDESFFKTVHIANGTVEWAEGQDIAPHELYDLSVPQPAGGIEEEAPDEIDLEMLKAIEEDPDCHEFISAEEVRNQLGI